MSDNSSRLSPSLELEKSTIRRIVRVILALAGLLVLLGLTALLPGIDRLVAGLSVSPWALVLAIATVLVVVALIWVAPTVERAVGQALDGPTDVVTNAGASAKLFVVFAAVVIAYRGLAPALTPLFRAFDIGGFYHLAFLGIGVLVLAAFARRLYRCWGPVTEILTSAAVGRLGTDSRNGVSTE